VKASTGHVDVARVRAENPIAEVVVAAGVDLRRRGRGWVGCCPFHEDHAPSLSVDAIPDRYHCFGCGASGDVIDFVARFHGLDFRQAVAVLENRGPEVVHSAATGAHRRGKPWLRLVRDDDRPTAVVTTERAFEINALAWGHLGTPTATAFARSWLRTKRGIDLQPLQAESPHAGLAGYASPSWTGLTDRLRADGVIDEELLALDLSQPGRRGQLLDTLRGRIVFPITEPDGRIRGFIGRDITGHPAAPKYRNPTRTPVHDKAQVLYRPSHHDLAADGSVVIVEGVLDALAIAATAAQSDWTHRVAPVTTGGTTVSSAQVSQVLSLSMNPPRIALDGDAAGRAGTDRWLTDISLQHHRPALVSRLPDDVDPADWLTGDDLQGRLDRLLGPPDVHDPDGSHLTRAITTTDAAVTVLPGRDLVRLRLQTAEDPIRDTVTAITPLTRWLGPSLRHALLEQATAEMTRHGWNPKGAFTHALHHALEAGPSGIPPPHPSSSRASGPELW
jgi:DNA primase